MREKRWLLLALFGIILANAVSVALKATRPKFKIATTSTTTTTTTEEAHAKEDNGEQTEGTTTVASETNATTGHTLTGIPQIDYIWDPNLPRELNGYNLSDYPFYNSIPEDIDFKCDGLHDGFYASVPHKCQVYHHCLFGTRYDFLCANFTAFDQKTFICHFVSEVDCANSKKYWHRNDALYKAATTTSTTSTSTTTVAPVTAAAGRSVPRDRDLPRRRRPYRRRPAYEYYDEDYYDEEYSRPRGYTRDDYDYDDRKYRRDRDRDFRDRDRDFRDREIPRAREGTPARDDRDRDNVRDRYPGRNNRRDPSRARDPLEEDTRVRVRDPDQGSRTLSREVDDIEIEDRRPEARGRDADDRRYSDKRFREDYDDKEPANSGAATPVSTEGLVKPAAPVSSVYARPRAPPKIRRPVPLSEQDRYAYKATSVQSTEEPRRRPVEIPEDDYYDDELEDIRPIRRPLRRRPSYRDRERDRDFYDSRDRDRDRPFRTRYRDEEEDLRPRKHSDRPRDRYYDRDRDRGADRGRDRSLDRGKDRSLDRDRGRSSDGDRQERPYSRTLDRERELDRPRSTSSRSKDQQEATDPSRRQNIYDRTSERTNSGTTTSTTSTTCLPEQLVHRPESESKETVSDRSERPTHVERPSRPSQTHRAPVEDHEPVRELEKPQKVQHPEYQDRELDERREDHRATSSEEYSSEYYDEPEDPPSPPPPRTAVRIVKRPFLPSRGGNPNPRGLSPVGSKAVSSRREENKGTERSSHDGRDYYETSQEHPRNSNQESKGGRPEEKQNYDAYKVIQAEVQQKHNKPEEHDTTIARPVLRRPVERHRGEEDTTRMLDDSGHREENRESLELESAPKWNTEGFDGHNEGTQTAVTNRGKSRYSTTEFPTLYSSSYKTEENQEQPSGPGNYRAKQRINEVTHRLQDIPESEYDVTLNDALTPTLNQETNLPSGFVLPLHRQIGRDTVLQSTENNYKISRPVNSPQPQPQQQQQQQQQQQHQEQQQQQQQQGQQKPFVPSPQFLAAGVNNNERIRTVYYRTPETIQISGAQYRQTRGPWHDYTGY